MEELPQPGMVCPKCGFDVSKYQRPRNSLPLYEIVNGKYLIGRVLGIGGFGITYIAWDFYQGKRVCVKEYFPREIAIRTFRGRNYTEQLSVSLHCGTGESRREPEQVQQAYLKGLQAYMKEAENLSHYYLMPGIVSIRDFFYGNQTAYIVMEYIDGIDMKRYAAMRGGKLLPAETFAMLRDVLKALDAVHKDNIIHRDISPDNIMLTRKSEAKLIDFGAARDYVATKDAPVMLKHGYAPVEQYMRNSKQGPWTDVYSMCASIYYLLTGVRLPASPKRQQQDTVARLQVMGVPIPDDQDLAIMKGLSIAPGDRYQTIGELYQAIYHEPIS
jgi:serine/threonine protein kinase